MEAGQCGKVRTDLWVTIGDAGADATSATVSAKKVSIRLAVGTTVFRPRAILAAATVSAAAVTGSVAAVAVIATAAAAAVPLEAAASAAARVVLAAAAVLADLAARRVCPRRSSAPAKAP